MLLLLLLLLVLVLVLVLLLPMLLLLLCEKAALDRRLLCTAQGSPEYKEGVASFIERRTPEFEDYDPSRPLIQKANEYFEGRGANLLGKL